MTATFGTEQVCETARRGAVTTLFDRFAPRHDLMNDLMSFGTHRLWKRVMVARALAHPGDAPGPVLDFAGGTGHVALGLRRQLANRPIIIADASASMLEITRKLVAAGLNLVEERAFLFGVAWMHIAVKP